MSHQCICILIFFYPFQVAKLQEVCGFSNDLDEFLRRALSCVLSNVLASKFSYKGARGKLKFEDLQFMKILKCMWIIPLVFSKVYNLK